MDKKPLKPTRIQPSGLLESALQTTVREIWDRYDTDHNGVLDRDELRFLVKEMLSEFATKTGKAHKKQQINHLRVSGFS